MNRRKNLAQITIQLSFHIKKKPDFRLQDARKCIRNRNFGKSTANRSVEKGVRQVDEPVKYFGTPVEKIRATPAHSERPKYSPHIVHVSLMVFLIYFTILREENDTDDLLKRDLYDHFGEEASRLKKAYDYNIKNNLPTTEIVNRLREIGAPVPPSMR